MDDTARERLLASVAATIADYRRGEIETPTADHVERWLRQFHPTHQPVILAEMDRLLKLYYVSEATARDFVRRLLANRALLGRDGRTTLRRTQFLATQRKGGSQRDLLKIVDETARDAYGLGLSECDDSPAQYLYFDDCLFSGGTALEDLTEALPTLRRGSTLRLVFFAVYWDGVSYLQRAFVPLAQRQGIRVTFWRAHEFCNLPRFSRRYDCLWPRTHFGDLTVLAYADAIAAEGVAASRTFRPRDSVQEETLFSSIGAREVVERAFLTTGMRIITSCYEPSAVMRPLGYESRPSLGYGAIFATYRNCPNNCPLALWWGVPGQWYPLLPRKTRDESATERLPETGM
ncbi:MAG: hypothetical protein U0768_06320 [Anaerolineae bacterium]